MYRTVLFDLDGTLTDPGEGITSSVAYALGKWGIEVPDRTALYPFIGPPLKDSFMKYYGFSQADAEEAIVQYRVYFTERGIFENRLYAGIPELLGALRAHGRTILLATSKPEAFARRILDHFALTSYFDGITGASMDGSLSKKGDVIAKALADAGVDPRAAVMVGDRRQDIQGAQENRIDSIGVLYGYGDRAEHETAGATQIAETVGDLYRLLLEKR